MSVARIELENGKVVLVDVHESAGQVERVGIGETASKTFESAWDAVQPLINVLAKKVAAFAPAEAQIKFGIKISADFNAIIASSKGEANFEVTLSYKPSGGKPNT